MPWRRSYFTSDLGEGQSTWKIQRPQLAAPVQPAQLKQKQSRIVGGVLFSLLFQVIWLCRRNSRSLAVNLKLFSSSLTQRSCNLIYPRAGSSDKQTLKQTWVPVEPYHFTGEHLCQNWEDWHWGTCNPITLPGKSAVWPAFWTRFR